MVFYGRQFENKAGQIENITNAPFVKKRNGGYSEENNAFSNIFAEPYPRIMQCLTGTNVVELKVIENCQ